MVDVPRRNRVRRPRGGGPSERPLGGIGASRVESGPDGDWMVRTVPAAQAVKEYRCPGCDHEIRAGVAHVVAWPDAEFGGTEVRRHWHTGCWHRGGRSRRR